MIGSFIAANSRRSHDPMSHVAGVTPVPGDSCAMGRLDSTDSMTQNRIESATAQPTAPPILVSWLAVFRPCFTAPVWNHILVLVAGAVLAPGKRTVTQALRVMGLADRPGFGRYHEVLNRARWDARDVARRLLLHLLAVLLPSGEVVIGIDDTIERRWGGKIKARGIYRDAVRSSHGHFVKTSGLRWLSLAVMLPVPFAGRLTAEQHDKLKLWIVATCPAPPLARISHKSQVHQGSE